MPKRVNLDQAGWLTAGYHRPNVVAVEVSREAVEDGTSVALGRNGMARVTGMALSEFHDWVMVQPFNTAGNPLRCYITIPSTAMDKLAFQWLQYRGKLPKGGDK